MWPEGGFRCFRTLFYFIYLFLEHYFNNCNNNDKKFFTFILFIHRPRHIRLHFCCLGFQPPETQGLPFLRGNNSMAWTPTGAPAEQINLTMAESTGDQTGLWRTEMLANSSHRVPGIAPRTSYVLSFST